MTDQTLRRRVAAWLLTLPKPVAAATDASAREALRLAFDPRVPQPAFDSALTELGYDLSADRDRRFRLHSAA
ncbi:MAG: hypothetical protein GC189_11550 [Alphaproteobacteria bacterium]|nr:hypothetical protein [Alphaproteobacteria bacterium]